VRPCAVVNLAVAPGYGAVAVATPERPTVCPGRLGTRGRWRCPPV